MPTFPYTIHDKDYDFLPMGYYLVYPVDAESALGRQVFTTMSKLEKERDTREHRESGSKYNWQGGSVEKAQDVTFTRGIAKLNGVYDNGLEAWYDNPVKRDLYVDVFPDGAEDIEGGTDVPAIRYQLFKAKPKKYSGFQGDAKSSDTALEELVVAIPRWKSVVVS